MADIFLICLTHVDYFQMEVDNTNMSRSPNTFLDMEVYTQD